LNSIEFDAPLATRQGTFEISAPMGAGNSYQVMINNYYNGSITKTANCDWQIHLHPSSTLQGDDVSVIIDLIEQNLADDK
jgi:hypothetical protein